MNPTRVSAVVLRQALLYRRSLPRLAEIFYWPLVDVLVWAFLSLYLRRIDSPSFGVRAAATLVGALILWDLLFRSQQAVSMSFLEDVWSRNLLNVFASPIRPSEYVVGGIVAGMIKVAGATAVTSLVAWALTGFGLLSLGLPLAAFVANLLVMGWAVGIFAMALILYYGEAAETLAWALSFMFQPLSAVFYPVETMPAAFRAVATVIPATHVFEGMRSLLDGRGAPLDRLAWAAVLNAVYLLLAVAFFAWMFDRVRTKGLLTRFGE